ncbi:unnamed protein product [Parajaminaea phylloscopi]
MALEPDIASNGHASYSSLPTAAILSHEHPELKREAGGSFSPSDLLCSLLPNTLSTVAQDLSSHDAEISTELRSIVDKEYRDFIQLATRLAGERQRIDRLAHWADGTGQEGLEGVRLRVQLEKDHIQSAQSEVQDLISAKGAVENRRAQLRLLLSFADTLQRLESLLSVHYLAEPSAVRQRATPVSRQHRAESAASTLAISEEDDKAQDADIDLMASQDADEVGSDGTVSSAEDEDENRRNHGAAALTDLTVSMVSIENADHDQRFSASKKESDSDLPTLIGRSTSLWERLSFIRTSALVARSTHEILDEKSAATDHPASGFLAAHESRLAAVVVAIKSNLRQLICRLLSPGSALLDGALPASINGKLSTDRECENARTLRAWSQIVHSVGQDIVDTQRRNEQIQWLSSALRTWLKVSSTTTDGVEEVRRLVAENMVSPWVEALLDVSGNPQSTPYSDAKVAPAEGSSGESDRQGTSPFEHIFRAFLRYLETYRTIIAVADARDGTAEGAHKGVSGDKSIDATFGLFENVFWANFSSALVARQGHALFFVGRLEDFHCNYLAAESFLTRVEEQAPSASAIKAWKVHASYTEFRRKWQLGVYFQMRHREVATRLEKDLASTRIAVEASRGVIKVPLMGVTRAGLAAFVAPWSPQSHLKPLSAKEWRLSLMSIRRYYAWICAQLPSEIMTSARQGSRSVPSAKASAIDASDIAGTAATQSHEDLMIKILTTIVADALWYGDELPKRFETSIAPQLVQQSPAEEAEICRAMTSELALAASQAFPFRAKLLGPISDHLANTIASHCSEPLRLVRSVSATNQRSAVGSAGPDHDSIRGAGPEASYFVPQIFRPLRQFFGLGDRPGERFLTMAALVQADVKSLWATSVVNDVATKYTASLVQMIQNFESLKRLKRGGGTIGGSSLGGSAGFGGLASSLLGRSSKGASASGADAEWERMNAQMKADVRRLEQDVKELGEVGATVDLEASEAWRSLRRVIDGERPL